MVIIYADLGIIALFLILGVSLGANALRDMIAVLLGPIKILFIILFVISLLVVLYYFKERTTGNRTPKIIGAVLYAAGNMLRTGMYLIFAFCILYGFLLNWDQGGFHMLWAIFAIFSDTIVFGLVFWPTFVPELMLKSDTISELIPAWVIGIIGLVWSILIFVIMQGFLSYYDGVVIKLFPKEFADFLLRPLILDFISLF